MLSCPVGAGRASSQHAPLRLLRCTPRPSLPWLDFQLAPLIFWRHLRGFHFSFFFNFCFFSCLTPLLSASSSRGIDSCLGEPHTLTHSLSRVRHHHHFTIPATVASAPVASNDPHDPCTWWPPALCPLQGRILLFCPMFSFPYPHHHPSDPPSRTRCSGLLPTPGPNHTRIACCLRFVYCCRRHHHLVYPAQTFKLAVKMKHALSVTLDVTV